MRATRIAIMLLIVILSGYSSDLFSQVKITDGTDQTPDQNSILELESTSRGFLPPRIAINSLSQASPLTAPVPSGMLVYSSGGTVPDGFYYWSGSGWVNFTGSESLVTRTTSSAILKTDKFVLGSGDITLTLPSVTASDNGLSITIKNIGTYMDLVTVNGSSGAVIDGISASLLTRWQSRTYVAYNGAWLTKSKSPYSGNTLVVSESGSFTTVSQAVEFLAEHMDGPVILLLSPDIYTVTETVEIDLPYSLSVSGSSSGTTTVGPGAGMSGKVLFNCESECFFEKINFDAGTLSGYGSSAGEDAIHLSGSKAYYEIINCRFDGFYNSVSVLSDAELRLFESYVSNSSGSGLIVNSSAPGAVIRVSDTDFTDNSTGVNLYSGTASIVSLSSGYYSNENSTDVAILYNPPSFTFSHLSITDNAWNKVGEDISGFDFTRSDGRDADAYIENNEGMENQIPQCKLDVVNNSQTTSCTVANAWYKASWVNTSSETTNFSISGNNITYLPERQRNLYLIISGNISVANDNRVITIGIVKNGVTTTRYGETALRVTTANQPYQFSTVISLDDISGDDYFELYCSSSAAGEDVVFQDVHLYLSAR